MDATAKESPLLMQSVNHCVATSDAAVSPLSSISLLSLFHLLFAVYYEALSFFCLLTKCVACFLARSPWGERHPQI